MKLTLRIQEAREAHERSMERYEAQGQKIADLPEEATEDERKIQGALFKTMGEEVERLKDVLEREISVQRAREATPQIDERDEKEERKVPAMSVTTREPFTYEDPQKGGKHQFFRDLVQSKVNNDPDALDRLMHHRREMEVERRDVTSADPGAAGFIPPVYLGGRWIDSEKFGRPFADAVTKMPPPTAGQTMTIPKVATSPATAVQAAEADAVNETNFDASTVTADAVTIAGQNDVSIQAFDFTDPGLEDVIMRELTRDYNVKLDTQLISGSGSNGQHEGIRTVSNIGSVAFASGGADDLLGKIYEAQASISTNAPGYLGNVVLMHPRRAAWMASHRDTSHNLLQTDAFVFAAGDQEFGFSRSVSDLRVIRDGNISTALGTNTRDDEVFVLDPQECLLAEGSLRARVLSEVLSGTLQVRIQLYSYSWFFGGRRPATIVQISGAGFTTPTFPST